jgi:hypothetical protein
MSLTQAQRNAVFTNIGTAYTVDGNAYTAYKTYREHWSGELDAPVIALDYLSRDVLAQGAIGREEWDTDLLSIDIYALTDHTNGVHGALITNEISRELILWFKESADAALVDDGVKISRAGPTRSLSALEEGVYRRQFDVLLLYKLI